MTEELFVSVIGKPLFSFHGYTVYNPFFYFLSIFKYGFTEQYQSVYFESFKILFIYLLIMFISGLAWTLSLNFIFKEKENVHGTARFSTKKELKKNGLLKETGVICGECAEANVEADFSGGNLVLHLNKPADLVCHSGNRHTIVCATTGTAKGVSVVIPTLLTWGQSVICFDPKGENYEITAGYRSTFSHVLRFDPCSYNTIRFNPVMAIRDGDEYAYRDASLLASILFAPDKAGAENDNSKFFSESAKDIITGTLLHIRFSDLKDKSFHGLMDFLCTDVRKKNDGKDEAADKKQAEIMCNSRHFYTITQQMYNNRPQYYKKLHKKVGDEIDSKYIHDLVVKGATRTTNRNEKSKADVMSTLFTKIQLFEDKVLADATSGSDFLMEDFIDSDKPISLYLCIEVRELDRLSFVIKVIITFMLKKLSEGTTSNNTVKLKNKILFLLDEFPLLGAFPEIEKAGGILRGYGIFFLIVCQNLSQLVSLYGPNHSFFDHCTCRIVYTPGSYNDAEYFSKMIGQESIQAKKLSRNGLIKLNTNNLSFSSNDYGRNLLDPSDIMRIPGDTALLMVNGMQPYLMKKVVYYEDPRFTWKLEYKAPQTMTEQYREIAELPSRKRIKEAIKKRFEEEAKTKNINDIELEESEAFELEEEFCMSDEEELEYHRIFNFDDLDETESTAQNQVEKKEVNYKYGTSGTQIVPDFNGCSDTEEDDNSESSGESSDTSNNSDDSFFS